MQKIKPITSEIRDRGQLTIPKKIRDMSHLEEGQVVFIFSVGDSVMITPKRLELEEARSQIKKILKNSGLTAEQILESLKMERKGLHQEIYGKKEA